MIAVRVLLPHRTVMALLVAAAAAACAPAAEPETVAAFVGSATCGECHADVAARASGSVHALAMQELDSTTIGRFDGVLLTHAGVTSEFFRQSGKPMVRTAGVDGSTTEFEITHALGIFPLQQYLVRFPDGRFQVLPIAWDSRLDGDGGQRWFHMYPDDSIAHTDELHWTGPQQNWNYMCADCHVTGLERNYDAAADAYRTEWHETGVRCEACHGPGSRHVALAREWDGEPPRERDGEPPREKDGEPSREREPASGQARDAGAHGRSGLLVDLSTGGGWVFDDSTAIARRTEPLAWNAQTETCGVCHARRETLVTNYTPGRSLLATHRPVLLEEGLYHADGQIRDEVYEYGSFLQSRMHRAGVTCSDCHDAATQQVPPGNAVCATCHRPDVFDTPEHHFHDAQSTGASCVACHMPPRTYMHVQPRHDHSLRVPRPDVSMRIGTPNACTTCHTERSDAWAADAVERRHGAPTPLRHYGDVLDAGRRGLPFADTALIRLAGDTTEAGIVRATAVSLLNRYDSPGIAAALERAARDAEPLVRLAAAMASEVIAPDARLPVLAHLLTDSLLAIRVETARVLAEVPDHRMGVQHRAAAEAAFDEFIAAQLVNAERPESHLRLGVFYAQRGRLDLAERAYRDAIRVGPRYAGGYLNLADLYRAQGRDAEGEQVLRNGLQVVHQPAVLHHSLGLLLVRRRRMDQAMSELARAVVLDPEVPRFAHVYAVALQSVGRTDEAIGVLEDARQRAPGNAAITEALASMREER